MKNLLLTWISCMAVSSLSAADFTLQVKDARGLPACYAEINVNDYYYRTDAKGEAVIDNLEEAGTYPITYQTHEYQQVEVQFNYSGGSEPQTVTMKDNCLSLAFTGIPKGEESWDKEISLEVASGDEHTSYAMVHDTEGWSMWTASSSFTYKMESRYYGRAEGTFALDASTSIHQLDLTEGKKSVCLLPALDADGNVLEDGSYSLGYNSYSFSDLKEKGKLHIYYAPEEETDLLNQLSVWASGLPYAERIETEEKDGEQVVLLDMANSYRVEVLITGQDGKPLSEAGIYTAQINDPESDTQKLMNKTDAQGKAVLLLPKNLVYQLPMTLWLLPEDIHTSCIELCSFNKLDADEQITKDLSSYRNYTLTLKNAAKTDDDFNNVKNKVSLMKEGSNYAWVTSGEMRVLRQGNDILASYSFDTDKAAEGEKYYFQTGGESMVAWNSESFDARENYSGEVDYALRRNVTLHSPEGLAVSMFSLKGLNSYRLSDDRTTVMFTAMPGTYTYTVTPKDLATGNTLKESGELQLSVGNQDVEETYNYTVTDKMITFHIMDIQGKPAQNFQITAMQNRVETDEQGNAMIYAEAGKDLSYRISDIEGNYLPLDSSLLVGEENMEVTIDFGKIYRTVTLDYQGVDGVPYVFYSLQNKNTYVSVSGEASGSKAFYVPDGTYYVEVEGSKDGFQFGDNITFAVDGKDVAQTFDFSGYGTLTFDYIDNEEAMGGADIYVTPIVNGVPGKTELYSYFLPKGTYYITAECNLGDYQGEVGDEIGYHLFMNTQKVEMAAGSNVHLTFDFSDLSKYDRVAADVQGAPEGWVDGEYTIDGLPAYENQIMYLGEGEHFYKLTSLANESLYRHMKIIPKTEFFNHKKGESTVVMDLSDYAFPYLKQPQTRSVLTGELTLVHENGGVLTTSLTISDEQVGLPMGKYTATLVKEGQTYTASFEVTATDVPEIVLNFVATGIESVPESAGFALIYQNNALKVNTASSYAQLKVFDASGRQAMSRKVSDGESVRVDGLSKGIYIATLTDKNGTKSLKFTRP